jgi:hypothetical protein
MYICIHMYACTLNVECIHILCARTTLEPNLRLPILPLQSHLATRGAVKFYSAAVVTHGRGIGTWIQPYDRDMKRQRFRNLHHNE